jgi:conjugative transfer signal peptidase TraF
MNRGQSDRFSTLVRTSLLGVGLCVVVFQVCESAGMRVNVSRSLPMGLYIVSGTGKLVEFCPSEPFASMAIVRGYRTRGMCPDGGAPLLKPVVASAGDVVDVSVSGIIVNNVPVPNTAPLSADTEGRSLAHWPFGRYTVPPECVWVASSYNPRSFDSRYFGPLAVRAIRHRVRALLAR